MLYGLKELLLSMTVMLAVIVAAFVWMPKDEIFGRQVLAGFSLSSSAPTKDSALSYSGKDSHDGEKRERAPCGGGIIDRLAISKPEPVYPRKARAARVSGRVLVQVQVDEEGGVASARTCSGPLALRRPAIDAARKARFTPTMLAGKPVKITGVLTYNFMLR
ncbi:MAG: energy transducer TonB [Pyrinomonadaceae bacterium]